MLTTGRPLRVGVLCSRRAPGFSELVERSRRGAFRVACVLTSEEEFAGRAPVEDAGVPLLYHPVRAFHRVRRAPLSDRAVRAAYDEQTAERLAPFHLDLVVLSSYLYVLTKPMLEAFPDRIFNVHGSDLARMGDDGRPLYVGLRAVRDAIAAGEPETRASLHLVTEALDEGPVLLRSWPFPVSQLVADARAGGDRAAIHAYAFAHQEWMLRNAWGPLLGEAIELWAGVPVDLDETGFRIGPLAGPWEIEEDGGIAWDAAPRPALRLAAAGSAR